MSKLILIVDDDALISENLEAYLEDEGFKVCCFESGEMALEGIKTQDAVPHLGIINMRLPGMNGNEVIEALMERYPTMAFLVHTGATDYVLPENLIAKGLKEECIMIKPVSDMKSFKDKILERL